VNKLTLKSLCVTLLILAGRFPADASVIYLYDFPGSPGSGLAIDQANWQPSGARFGDFARTNVDAASGNDLFKSNNWNQGLGRG
jgi:hypothetical protein